MLEVACDSGLNLPSNGHEAKELWANDPSLALMGMGYRRAKDLPFAVEFLDCTETIPTGDRSVDAVVTMWTLCRVSHVVAACPQARRAPALRHEQRSLRPWSEGLAGPAHAILEAAGGGCHLNRKPNQALRRELPH
ncbi:MAG: hypothetical protein HYX38_11215 [Rhodospirillales bacterium]|nr:hypothetical protein [Rhodospirillales bacterium]